MDKEVKSVALELQPCCGNRSGIGTFTYELARRLKSEDGLEFCGNLFNFLGRNDNAEILSGIDFPIRESKVFPYGVYRRIWNVLPLSYGTMFPQTDVSVFFDYIVPPRVSGKVITTIHDMTYLRFPDMLGANNLRRIKTGMPFSVARSNRVLTVSEFSKREIIELLNIPDDKISIVYSAPSLSDSITDFDTLQQKFLLNKPYILYVGTIEPRKNLERLLKAFEILKAEEKIPHQLVLAGGKGWKSEGIYETVKSLSCSNDVIFTGYISAEEKNALYQNAAAFVFPSVYEGFGMPPLEAMHFDCPVVCSDAASLPEVVGDAAELVDPYDVDSICCGINRVLTDKAYAGELVERGKKQREKFTWEASAKQLTKVCREVLEEA